MNYYLTLLRLRDIAAKNSGIIRKGKKYLKTDQKPPKGVITHRGPKGGTYYIIEDRHTKIAGKHHELVRSKGVTKDQWEEVRNKHLSEGAESVEFIPQPEYGGVEGKKLYNIYVRWQDTDEKLAKKKQANKEKFGKKKLSPDQIQAEIDKIRGIGQKKLDEASEWYRGKNPNPEDYLLNAEKARLNELEGMLPAKEILAGKEQIREEIPEKPEKSSEPHATWTNTENYSRGDVDPMTGGRDIYHDIKVTDNGKSHTYSIRIKRAGSTSMSEDKASAKKLALEMYREAMANQISPNEPEPVKEEPKQIPADDTKITLYTSNKVGRARNLATERGVPMQQIHELYRQAEQEATDKYHAHIQKKEYEEGQKWKLQALYAEWAEKRAVELVNAAQPPAVEEGPVKAFILSGKTYPLKSDIKYQFQGKWSRDDEGWLIHGKHAEKVKEFAEKHGLTVEETEAEGDTFRMRTPDERRAIRAEKNQRKAARIRESAEKKLKEGESSWKAGEEMMDAIPFGQPILVGHHSEKRDRNYREKAWNKMDKGHQLMQEANKQLERATKLEKTPLMRGDTERKREKVYSGIREKAKNEMIPGKSQVDMGWLHGHNTGILVKFNEKSAVVYDPREKRSRSIPLIDLRLIDHEGQLPSKKELQESIQPTKTISKQEWNRTYHEDKMMDPYTRIRYIMEGSYATGRGWVPVNVE